MASSTADAAGSSSRARWSNTSLTSSTIVEGLSWTFAAPVATAVSLSRRSLSESSAISSL